MADVDDRARTYPRLRLQTLLLALIGAGIVHIVATLAWPHLAAGSAVRRFAAIIPPDVMQVLPPVTPKDQVLPFQAADVRYAACRFSVADHAYTVHATLPEAGWTLSVHNALGDGIYVVTGQDQKSTDIALLLLPPGDRFVGVLPEARLAAGYAQVSMPSASGLVLIRAPNKGAAYGGEVDAALAKASCTPRQS